MDKIKAILIDDEEKALASLQLKVNRFFPEIEIVATILDSQNAIHKINELKPNLVFIDIEMPILSGFDVLSKINNPDFEVIFVTAYSNYAIKAIQHCAIGYIVKPIDNDELKMAINNAIINVEQKTAFKKNIKLLAYLSSNNSTKKTIAIPSQKGLLFIKIEDIIRFEGIDGYTKIYITDRSSILSSYSIGKFYKMLENTYFFSCHKSHLINLNFVKSILKEGLIEIFDTHVPCAKAKRASLINAIKNN